MDWDNYNLFCALHNSCECTLVSYGSVSPGIPAVDAVWPHPPPAPPSLRPSSPRAQIVSCHTPTNSQLCTPFHKSGAHIIPERSRATTLKVRKSESLQLCEALRQGHGLTQNLLGFTAWLKCVMFTGKQRISVLVKEADKGLWCLNMHFWILLQAKFLLSAHLSINPQLCSRRALSWPSGMRSRFTFYNRRQLKFHNRRPVQLSAGSHKKHETTSYVHAQQPG